MGAYHCPVTFPERLFAEMSSSWTVFAAVTGTDGVCRLQPRSQADKLSSSCLPLLPLKKFVLPARDQLWSWQAGVFRPPPPSARIAVVGIAPCDLYALDYLDAAFAADDLYQQRREQLLLIGAPCTPGTGCSCPPRSAPPPFDLFISHDSVWSGSARGDAVLTPWTAELGEPVAEPLPASFWAGQSPALPPDLAARFARSVTAPFWSEVAQRCLSCGACSAVCPTCSCFAIVDDCTAPGAVERTRQWDNCFFREHALVAGGHNFRPDRTSRLRFRFEHKYLGFGAQRGGVSCVGCGRCRRACPVEIDLKAVLALLLAEEGA